MALIIITLDIGVDREMSILSNTQKDVNFNVEDNYNNDNYNNDYA